MNTVVRAVDVGYGNTKYISAASDEGVIECSNFLSLAALVPSGEASDIGGKRKTVRVRVDGVTLEVGPDVELAADRFVSRPLHDNFFDTAEYRALMSGALHFMRCPVIDLLVVGLPVALYQTRKNALAKAMTGTFSVGPKLKVQVRKAIVAAQPQGALFNYIASQAPDPGLIAKGRNLVIDVGSRTFDWLVTNGSRVQANMSHSVNRGVSDILRAIAQELSHEVGEAFVNLDAIDRSLRLDGSIKIYQRTYDLKRFDSLVQHVANQAVSALASQLDAAWNVENIVLVGGGAPLFRKAIKRTFPKHEILEPKDSLHANVRGFQLIGQRYVRENPNLFTAKLPDNTVPLPSLPAEGIA